MSLLTLLPARPLREGLAQAETFHVLRVLRALQKGVMWQACTA